MHGTEIDWVKQVLTTVLWLGIMCAVIWFILRSMYGRMNMPGFGGGTRRNIQLLDRLVLGPQKAILLVEVPGKVLLLGMTDQRITTLTELLPEDLETLNARPAARAPLSGVRPPEKPPAYEPSDNIVDLAGLFGRRTSQSKGEDQE